MNNYMISVIIPTYNREKTIKRAIDSVLNQSFRNLEVIVVDDCSTDQTEKVVKSIKDERLHYYKLDKNSGACVARNYGISKSQGEYIAFQDSDDEWHRDKIESQLKNLLKKKSDIDFCMYNRYCNAKVKRLPEIRCIVRFKLFGHEKSLCYGNYISTPAVLMKKECVNKYLFDDSLPRFQDWELLIRLSNKYKISFTNRVLANTYVQSDSITMNTEKLFKAIDIMKGKDYKYKRILMGTLYSILASASKGENKKRYYKQSLKEKFILKNLIKYLINK